MSAATAHIHLKLDFDQVLNLVRQLPRKQQQQLVGMIGNAETPTTQLTEREALFLTELEEAVDFANNYQPGKGTTATFKQMLDAL